MQELKIGQIYRHFKGNTYKVIALARHSETDEEMVVYQSVKMAIFGFAQKRCGLKLLIIIQH